MSKPKAKTAKKATRFLTRPPLSNAACTLCLELAKAGKIRVEAVQRLPEGAWAPLSKFSIMKCCFDCQSAETLMHRRSVNLNFEQARVAVSNERQEQYRMPGAPLGLVGAGLVHPSAAGDLDDQHAWLDRMSWFYIDLDRQP